MKETPQQTSAVNCTVFALAWAIEEALRGNGPEYTQTVDRKALEALTGAPVMPSVAASPNNVAAWGVDTVALPKKDLLFFPIVAAFSGDGFAHTVGIRSATDQTVEVYDPAYGLYRRIARDRFVQYSGDWVLVGVHYPPVTKPWYRFAIVRFLARMFGLL